ncbi:MAG: OmpA family protein [Bacteroidota bacterium]
MPQFHPALYFILFGLVAVGIMMLVLVISYSKNEAKGKPILSIPWVKHLLFGILVTGGMALFVFANSFEEVGEEALVEEPEPPIKLPTEGNNPSEEQAPLALANRSIILRFTQKGALSGKTEYLKKVAQAVIQTHETITITGHTDNTTTAETSRKLGLAMANKVRFQLLDLGVEEDQIIVSSKGELQPIASNTTEEGRRLNRRVVVRIGE